MTTQQDKDDLHRFDPKMRPQTAPAFEYQWHDPRRAPMQIAGLAWFAQEGLLRRMPAKPAWKLPEAVDSLSDQLPGAQIRFRSNTRLVAVHVKLRGLASNPAIPATAQCGFDLYVGPGGDQRFMSVTKYDHMLSEYEYLLFDRLHLQPRVLDFALDFPLGMAIEDVQVGVEPGAVVEPPAPFAIDRPVIIYGTSVTHGSCASRPGMAYPSILGRRLNVDVVNLGFGGSGRGEPEVAHVIAEIPNPACLVLDYEANTSGLEHLQQTLRPFIAILRAAHPKAPILVATKIPSSQENFNDTRPQRLRTRDYQKSVVEDLRREGDQHVHFLDVGGLLNPDMAEGTVDGIHPTNLGFKLMADVFEPCLRRLIFPA
jgi:hypothetical protein